MPDPSKPGSPLRTRLFGWWYTAIGAGFTLLAINHLIVGGERWLVALRLAIAAGFFWLGYFELHTRRRQ